MQIEILHKKVDELQSIYGDKKLNAIYGAGCIKNPEVMFIFMNPTGKNVSACKSWQGIRAPWLGTKNIWEMFFACNIISEETIKKIRNYKPSDWTVNFSSQIYKELAHNKIYVTNLAKCTQADARPLKNNIFKKYLEIIYDEILAINPKRIVTFGNQVSSILLGKNISVSNYAKQKEVLPINKKTFDVYPVYYPVGQGQRNMPLAIKRIKIIL